jgi:hypothetical protein
MDMNATIPKEKRKWWTHKGESADAGHCGVDIDFRANIWYQVFQFAFEKSNLLKL